MPALCKKCQLVTALTQELGSTYSKVFSQVRKLEHCLQNPQQPMFFNTKPRWHSCVHWVAGCAGFFDSYGLHQQQESCINFLNMQVCEWQHLSELIQSFLTQACGQYCICFLLDMNEFNNFKHFLCLFSQTDLLSNDKRVHKK